MTENEMRAEIARLRLNLTRETHRAEAYATRLLECGVDPEEVYPKNTVEIGERISAHEPEASSNVRGAKSIARSIVSG
jgi:hypothetical protein